MDKKTQRRLNSSNLLLLAVAFIAAVIVSNQLFSGWRVDLTENKLYTLSDGTKRILENIDEPINLYFYFSDKATGNIPSLRDYANRVRELLEEFEDLAGGGINLTVIDPLPFSEDEDRAAQFGLQGISIPGAPDPVYMGLAGTDSIDNEEIISFFQPDKEAFLEYDLAKLVSTLANPERTVVGFVSELPIMGDFNPQTGQSTQPWVVYQQAEQLFEVRELGTNFDVIDEEISLLWIVQPKNLPGSTQYAIDQFVLGGGKALIFVDPIAESDPQQMQGMPQGMPPMGQGSDLPELFEGWGIEFSSKEVVTDAQLALQISTGHSPRPVRHFGYLGLTPDQVNAEDVVTADLTSINLANAGFVSVAEDSTLTLEALFRSSNSAQPMEANRFTFLPDPSTIQDDFAATGESYVIAARISGVLKSAFPAGNPADLTVDSDEPGDDEAEDAGEHLSESSTESNLIIVADVDMLGDQMWVQVQNFFGQRIANAFASNGAFVVNALESLSGSADLIGVRSRETYTRPFTRVDELRVEAESQYRQTEQRLQSELADTEARLGELQSSREDSGNILITPEQQAEIDRFLDRRAEIRKELRAVQRELDKNIEDLGARLKILNIAFVPFLLTVFALFAVWRRNRETS